MPERKIFRVGVLIRRYAVKKINRGTHSETNIGMHTKHIDTKTQKERDEEKAQTHKHTKINNAATKKQPHTRTTKTLETHSQTHTQAPDTRKHTQRDTHADSKTDTH